MRFSCTSWSWSLSLFEKVMEIVSILGFGVVDVGAFAGFADFEPVDVVRHPKEMASRLRQAGSRHKMVFSDLFLCFGTDLIEPT